MKLFLNIIILTPIIFCSSIFPQVTKSKIDSINQIPYKYIISNLQECVGTFKKNISDAEKINYLYGRAVALDKFALAIGISGNSDESAKAFLESARIFEKLEKFDELSMVYGGYGYGTRRRDISAANKYMRMGIGISEKHNLKMNLTTLYDNYGVLKIMEEKNDSAFFFYTLALDLKRELNDSVGIPYSLNKLAEIYTIEGNFKQALLLLEESDEYRNKEIGEFGRAGNLAFHAEIEKAMNNYNSAIEYFKLALAKGKSINYKQLVKYSYQQLSDLYEMTNKYPEALNNYKLFTLYQDSLNDIKMNNRISELQIKFETEKKDRQIETNKQEIENKTLQLWISIIVFFLIIVIFLILYRNYKQKQIHNQKEVKLKNKLEKAEIIQKHSNEKIRLSRDLHDNIGSNLTFIINALENIGNQENSDLLNRKIESVSEIGRESISDLRDSIWALKLDDGDTSILLIKVNELKFKLNEIFDEPEIVVENRLSSTHFLTSAAMLNLYRIVQEGIQNAVKHAEAKKIKITFFDTESDLNISIKDDGKGFSFDKSKMGNGLENMKSRIEGLNGIFSFKSDNDGTNLTFVIPKK